VIKINVHASIQIYESLIFSDVFEDAMVEAKAKARSFQIKAAYAYEILHD